MKKILIIILALILMLSFVACGGGGKSTGGDSGAPAGNSDEPSAPAGKASAPADSYQNYIDQKSKAYERLTSKIEENSELALTAGLALLPVVMVDLALLPLTIVGVDGGEAALAVLGMEGVKVAQDGNTYTITYKDTEGKSITQTCEYDAKSDSIKSVIKDGDKQTMFFEYVYIGGGYASQYYMLNEEEGNYTLITSYFNDSDFVGFGIATAKKEPASIYKNGKLSSDFIVNDESYFMLEGDVMTIFTEGEKKTY